MKPQFQPGLEPADPITQGAEPITILINGSGFGVIACAALLILALHLTFRAGAQQ